MHNDRAEKLILHATSLKLAAPSGQYIPDPPTISSLGERDEESAGLSEDIDRYRPLAKPNKNDQNHQDYQKRNDRCGNDPGRLSSYPLYTTYSLKHRCPRISRKLLLKRPR